MLDVLRGRRAYPISLVIIEEGWNADLPLDLLGRLAEDWLGTVLHGLGDPAGVVEVAHHLKDRAMKLSPSDRS